MAQVRLEKVTKKYGKTEAVRDLDLIVEDSEFMTLVGPSGCGKSTTLRMIAGLEEIKGSIYFNGVSKLCTFSTYDRVRKYWFWPKNQKEDA